MRKEGMGRAMANILAVDDEEDILVLIKNALRKEGHQVTCVGDSALVDMERLKWYDLILLDVMMPGKDGFSLCREIRDVVDCPVIFLTAKTQEEDVTWGLSIGGDDYIRKPFSLAELRARVSAHLRREHREKKNCFTVSGVRFFPGGPGGLPGEAFVGQVKLNFTKSEYQICELLARYRGQVFSREQIYEQVFGYEGESDASAITEHIKNIRRKMLAAGVETIETVWGIGYKWCAREQETHQ